MNTTPNIRAEAASQRVAFVLGGCLLFFILMVGFVWYERMQPPGEFKTYKGLTGLSSNDLLTVKMERMAEQAAMDAWTRARIRVRIGIHSLPEFERYLGRVAQSPWFKAYSPKDKQAESIIAGAFVGEAIRRTHGGAWLEKPVPPENLMMPFRVGELTIYPETWCLKRLVNGPEDNIYQKYLFLILNRTNELHGEITYWTNAGSGLKPLTNVILK